MGKKRKKDAEADLSSFMSILLMTIGVLITVLVANTIVIISNPENIYIRTVAEPEEHVSDGEEDEEDPGHAKMGPPAFGNTTKQPTYVDVHRDRLIVYNVDTNTLQTLPAVLPLSDLEIEGNAFSALLSDIYDKRDQEYIILLARPRSASNVRRLKKIIKERGIQVGHELFEAKRKVRF